MNYFKCINQVKPSYVVDTEPQFSETVLYQNQTSTGQATITLSDNYHNYDIIKFICCDTNTGNSLSSYYTTPATMDHMVADNPYINCNVMNTNHFVTCTIASNTQLTNCTHSRYLYVTKVIGLNCSNGTLVETEIYSGFRTGSWFSIETELNLFDFNMILAQTCTSGYDENNITNNIYIRPNNNLYLGNTDIANQLTEWRVSYYGNSYVANITEHTISSGKWYYVTGLKFIPNWDFYVENIEFAGPYEVDTGIQLSTRDGLKRDWEMEFKTTNFGDNDARLLNNYVGGWDSFSWYYGGTNPNGTYGGYAEWGGGNYATTIAVDLNPTVWKFVKKNGYIRIYKNGVAEYDFLYNPTYGSYPTGTFKLGHAQISTKCTLHYFGFRWLS